MTKYNGFTLIELLAVVLIIAILTSIAMPQYRRSIRRAEAVEAMINLRTVYDAAKRYKAATSAPALKLHGLDVEFFDVSTSESSFLMNKFIYSFETNGIKSCRANNGGFCLHFYYKHNSFGKDALICEVQDGSKTGQQICESLSGKTETPYLIE